MTTTTITALTAQARFLQLLKRGTLELKLAGRRAR